MKKTLLYLITSVMVAGTLAGCGGNSSSSNSYKAAEAGAASEEAAYFSDDMYAAEEAMYDESYESEIGNGTDSVDDETVENSNRKIIKNVNIDAETEEFDTFIANIDAKVRSLGGYMESTNISGRSINASKGSLRNANITARIPAKNLDSFVTNVADISNITNKSESAEDVTLNYADTQAHIKSLRTEQERLDQLLLQADDIETIIAIESRITDVRYELESYESRLRAMDNKVDYSTVYIYVKEVERYTPVEEHKQTVGERIITGFTENLISAKDFVVDFIVELIIAIPIIVVLLIFVAIPVVIIYFFVRYIIGRVKGPEYREERKAKKAAKKLKKAEKKSANKKTVEKIANKEEAPAEQEKQVKKPKFDAQTGEPLDGE